MLVNAHGHVKGALDIRHAAHEPEVHGVARAAYDFKAACLGERNQSVPVFLAGAKSRGKLVRRKKKAVERSGRIVGLLQEGLQPCAIPQRQNNVEMHRLCCFSLSDELLLPAGDRVAYMTRQHGLRLPWNG